MEADKYPIGRYIRICRCQCRLSDVDVNGAHTTSEIKCKQQQDGVIYLLITNSFIILFF